MRSAGRHSSRAAYARFLADADVICPPCWLMLPLLPKISMKNKIQVRDSFCLPAASHLTLQGESVGSGQSDARRKVVRQIGSARLPTMVDHFASKRNTSLAVDLSLPRPVT
jgi:hypothetical protein